MLDHAEVLISGDKRPQGPSLMDLMGGTAGRGIDLTPRNLPVELLASMLSQQSGQQVRPGNIREWGVCSGRAEGEQEPLLS